MSRLIVLGLVIAAVVWFVRRLRERASLADRARERFEPTVRCRECGAYIAERQAIADADGTGHRCAIHETRTHKERVS